MKYKPDKKYKLTIKLTKDIIIAGNEVEMYIKKIKEKYDKSNQNYHYWVE